MLSSKGLKEIVTIVRPIIERQLDDAEQIAAFRDKVAESGGDWSALKALIKAQIQDERDETGGGKRVKKILDKAGFSTDYAALLGWSNMNEKNFSAEEDFDRETGEVFGERRSDGGLSIITKHEDIRTSDGSPSVSSSLATREAEESVVPHSPVTAAVPSSEQSEGNGSRDHQHVHSRQTDDAKHGGQDGEPAGPDHATHLPETANETMGGTGDDCSFGNRGVWPPQGGASSSRGNDSLSVVTVGETTSVSPEEAKEEFPSDDSECRAAANAGGDDVDRSAARATTSNTGEGAANTALPAKSSIRPLCRNPGETCGGYGRRHCRACEMAGAELEDAE